MTDGGNTSAVNIAQCYLQDQGLAELLQARRLGDTQKVLQLADALATLLNLQLELIQGYLGHADPLQPFTTTLTDARVYTTYLQTLVAEPLPVACNVTLREVLDTMVEQRCIVADELYRAGLQLDCDGATAAQMATVLTSLTFRGTELGHTDRCFNTTRASLDAVIAALRCSGNSGQDGSEEISVLVTVIDNLLSSENCSRVSAAEASLGESMACE